MNGSSSRYRPASDSFSRDERRRLLELACEMDRLEWRLARQRTDTGNPVFRALDVLRFAQPFLPRYLRYALVGYSLARKWWGRL
ncbi:hypothetical protein OpiT1DRAFT_04225 [Opitutaceae bacterium TAV1]|nr:hypothetical protein OPIT5_05665 [Opitutaceae bacterium TAV5]EIP99697.1 hypothetical protein OpiT1DRAFT_04225 [Opitutaceae bacterium TAV1]